MNNEEIYLEIAAYAKRKHAGQFRKDGIEEYFQHPLRVSKIIEAYGGSLEQQCAGLLHDVVEDTGTSLEQLRFDLSEIIMKDFGSVDGVNMVSAIVKYVDDLTCKYTKEVYPHLNRAKRKKLELDEFKKMVDERSKLVKLADIIDNLCTIEKLDVDFAEQYLCEDFKIIRALKIEHLIYTKAVEVFKEAIGKML